MSDKDTPRHMGHGSSNCGDYYRCICGLFPENRDARNNELRCKCGQLIWRREVSK